VFTLHPKVSNRLKKMTFLLKMEVLGGVAKKYLSQAPSQPSSLDR